MFDVISETLDIETVIVKEREMSLPVPAQEVVEQSTELAKAEEDFDFARTTIRGAIDKAGSLLEDMADLARASEHPRSYEVANQIAANMAAMADSLVKLHKETLKQAAQKPPATVNNTLVVGSTNDFIKMIKEKNGSN